MRHGMNPGSDAAVAAGCTCPVGDNCRGRGAYTDQITKQPVFWYDSDCPLHDAPVVQG